MNVTCKNTSRKNFYVARSNGIRSKEGTLKCSEAAVQGLSLSKILKKAPLKKSSLEKLQTGSPEQPFYTKKDTTKNVFLEIFPNFLEHLGSSL